MFAASGEDLGVYEVSGDRERAALQSDTLAQIISGDESCLRDGTLSERQGLYTELLQNGL